jgi:hypothetical protein
MTGAVRNTTRIGSVLQSKVAKKDSRYKRLFALDDEDDDAEGLTDRPHIGRRLMSQSAMMPLQTRGTSLSSLWPKTWREDKFIPKYWKRSIPLE